VRKVSAALVIARSENMRRIRRRDTWPELLLRSALHKKGRRYRVDVGELPGRPDLVFTKKRVAVFVQGCFWHQHPNCRQASSPKTNVQYWEPKLARNVARDQRNFSALTGLNYSVLVFWECEIERDVERAVEAIERALDCAS
jgi:DNA mismatch endonuclease (patch repair protein)